MRNTVISVIYAAVVPLAVHAADATVVATTTAELVDAIQSMTSGGTVLLSPGTYDPLILRNKGGELPTTGIIITSEDAGNPAIFGSIHIDGVTDLTFVGLSFDYTVSENSTFRDRPFQIWRSKDIEIRNSIFDGDTLDGLNAGQGIFVGESQGILVTGTEFKGFHRAGVFTITSDLRLEGNEVHSIRSDGFDFAQVQNVKILNNHFHDFSATVSPDDHRDMIQFWTNGTNERTENVEIRGNLLMSGGTMGTQAIFMRNEVVDSQGGGEDMFYRHVTIEDNLIHNGHSHGITVGETDGLTIAKNTLLQDTHAPSDRLVYVPKINVKPASKNVAIYRNISGADIRGPEDWDIHANVVAKRKSPIEGERYETLFVNALTENPQLRDLRAIPGGLVDQLDAGAHWTHFEKSAETLTAQARAIERNGKFIFDGHYSRGMQEGATYAWDFGDGASALGITSTHRYTMPGKYVARLTITQPDGAQDTSSTTILQSDPQLLEFRFEGGMMQDFSYYGSKFPDATLSKDGVELSQAIDFGRGEPPQILSAKSLWISVDIKPSPNSNGGHLARVHGSWVLNVEPDGEVTFFITGSDGALSKLKSQGANLLSDGWKTVEASFEAEAKIMKIQVDGRTVGDRRLSTTMRPAKSHGLMLGTAFSWNGFQGHLQKFSVRNLKPDA